MIRSQELSKNPSLYVFLPLFYTVWADAVLTPSEVAAVEATINGQAWLTKEEKQFLLNLLNPAAPPSPDDLMDWREEITKVADTSGKKESLVDLGIKLATLHGNGAAKESLTNATASLTTLEELLGLISYEAGYNFQSGRNTITSRQETQHTF